MDYAIIATGGKQYRVGLGARLEVERLDLPEGKQLHLKEVLAFRNGSRFEVGRPHLANASVLVRVEKQILGPKLISFKFKRRKRYRRKVGHRQQLTRIKILEIQLNGATLKAPPEEPPLKARVAKPRDRATPTPALAKGKRLRRS